MLSKTLGVSDVVPSAFSALDTLNSKIPNWFPPEVLMSALPNQFFFTGLSYIQSDLCQQASFASELRRQLGKPGAHQRLDMEPSNAPSIWVVAGPIPASAAFCAHFVAPTRTYSPQGLLWPIPFSRHHVLLSRSPLLFT